MTALAHTNVRISPLGGGGETRKNEVPGPGTVDNDAAFRYQRYIVPAVLRLDIYASAALLGAAVITIGVQRGPAAGG